MTEGARPPDPNLGKPPSKGQDASLEAKPSVVVRRAIMYAGEMSWSLGEAAKGGDQRAGSFLKEFGKLQEKYPDLFPGYSAPSPAASVSEASPQGEQSVAERMEPVAASALQPTAVEQPSGVNNAPPDVKLAQAVTADSMGSLAQVGQAEAVGVQGSTAEISDEELAKSYPVTETSRQIVGELNEIENKWWKLSEDDLTQARQRQEDLRRQLSDFLKLPAGRNVATLEAEIARVEEVRHDAITIPGAIGGKLYTDKLNVLIQQASPAIQEAYSQYRLRLVGLSGFKDWEKRSSAEKAFEEECDKEVGITEEEILKEFDTHGVFPRDGLQGSVGEIQAGLVTKMWRQIENAKIAQSVYTRREAFLQGLAAKAGLVIYKTQMGYDTKPLVAGQGFAENAETPEAARAVVDGSIKQLASSYKDEYYNDNLRSPETTRKTYAAALAEAPGLVVDRTHSGELGKGAVATIYRGSVKGGIPGLRGSPTASTESMPVAVKTTTIDARVSIDRSTAEDVLATIEEAYVLDSIRRTQRSVYPGSRPFVPDSVLLQNYRGVPALVMEYIDHKYDIYRQKDTLTPAQLRSLSVQYFQLQDVIHTAGFTCNDVKGGDFFYKPEEDRLIVLDWNVTKPIKSPPERVDIEKMNGDLLIGLKYFGQDMAHRYTSEARDVIRSLESRILAKRSTVAFDAKELVRIMQDLPIAA